MLKYTLPTYTRVHACTHGRTCAGQEQQQGGSADKHSARGWSSPPAAVLMGTPQEDRPSSTAGGDHSGHVPPQPAHASPPPPLQPQPQAAQQQQHSWALYSQHRPAPPYVYTKRVHFPNLCTLSAHLFHRRTLLTPSLLHAPSRMQPAPPPITHTGTKWLQLHLLLVAATQTLGPNPPQKTECQTHSPRPTNTQCSRPASHNPLSVHREHTHSPRLSWALDHQAALTPAHGHSAAVAAGATTVRTSGG